MPTLFLYGPYAPGGEQAAWAADLCPQAGTTRGALWRDGRMNPVLVPGRGVPAVQGVVVDADPDRQRVLTLLLGQTAPHRAFEGPGWRPVAVSVGLRPVTALAWALPDARVARLLGYRAPRPAAR